MHQWQSFSEDEAWCQSGYDLVNIDNLQQAVNKIGGILVERMQKPPPSNLKIFIVPHTTFTPPT